MNKPRKQDNPSHAITVTLTGAKELTGLGRDTIMKIAKESGALIKVGNRNLFKVDVLKEYMNNL